ncbi:MAG: radical SAM family heme chaperone HemW [Lachnospiraceae bacterium]|nr:radical SAM family heme chaperone HemW [Lachnospiraceae bacterium]
MSKAGVYIHIPFCERKCNYCDFLSKPGTRQLQKEYVQALKKEIADKKELLSGYMIETVFIGGGTPSFLEPSDIREILRVLWENIASVDNGFCRGGGLADVKEITMEANPGTLTREKLMIYKEAGINRISMGLQSANNEELKELGRIHTYEQFLENYQVARECGFDNINIDLMSALPGQTVESYEETLRKVVALKPEHISAYSLIIEEGTPFYDKYGPKGTATNRIPSEETDRKMYHLTGKLLKEQGYHRYEISNYAREGKECEHNLFYWSGVDYIGFGLGAASLIQNVRYKNTVDMKQYLLQEDVRKVEYVLDKTMRMEEFMFLGLRKMQGVRKDTFAELFGQTVEEVYKEEIMQLKNLDLLEESKGYLRLTEQGIDVSNTVLAKFLL